MTVSNDNNEIKVVVMTGCGHCDHFKEVNKDSIANGRIKVYDVAQSEEARRLADKFGINAVPSPIVKDKLTGFEQVCQITGNGKKLSCPDGKEVEI